MHDHDHDHAHAQGAGHHHGGHDHGHAHGKEIGEGRLAILLGLTATYMGIEVVAGLWSGSLALLADAGHMASDAASLLVTLFAIRLARRPASPHRTYGWHRAEILAAAVNGGALVAIALSVLVEAAQRVATPSPVHGEAMTAVALGGLLINLGGVALLHGSRDASLNLRGAWLHAASDALGSVAALIAGIVAIGGGPAWADPVAGAAIALLVLRAAWRLLDDAVHVLMEGAPATVDVMALRRALLAEPGVRGVHDLHVWTITSGLIAMSGHVVTEDGAFNPDLLARLGHVVRTRFGVQHATIQLEPPGYDEAPTCE